MTKIIDFNQKQLEKIEKLKKEFHDNNPEFDEIYCYVRKTLIEKHVPPLNTIKFELKVELSEKQKIELTKAISSLNNKHNELYMDLLTQLIITELKLYFSNKKWLTPK